MKSRIVENVRPVGQPTVTLYGPDGEIKAQHTVCNLVVTAGKNWIAERIDDDTDPADMGWIAIGTGTTSPVVGDTALETENVRVANDSAGVAGNVTTYTATFGPGVGTAALTEAGIFNDASTGSMLARVTFPVVNKGTLDTMVISWDLTIN